MKTIKVNVPLFFVISFLLTGCLTAKKVDRQVATQYADKQKQIKKQPDNISVTSELLSADSKVSSTETKTSNMLPLVFYWSFDYKNTCTINPRIPINNFTATVMGSANKNLKEKLTGQKLELSVDQIPNKFAIDDKAHVSYKLTKENTDVKTGTITIPYSQDKKHIGMYKSWKKATSEYLDVYDANITVMSKLVVEKLAKEL